MSRLKSLSVLGVALFIVLGGMSFSHPTAKTPSGNQSPQNDNGQPMQALLNEVRLLRLAIQRSNLNTYHAQVTLERLRMQQQVVDRLSGKLEDARARSTEFKMHHPRLLEEIKRTEDYLDKEADPVKRRDLEGRQQSLKSEAERFAQMETQARDQETQLAIQLQMEQAKLNEINERLDTLQKELEVVDKTPSAGKQQ